VLYDILTNAILHRSKLSSLMVRILRTNCPEAPDKVSEYSGQSVRRLRTKCPDALDNWRETFSWCQSTLVRCQKHQFLPISSIVLVFERVRSIDWEQEIYGSVWVSFCLQRRV